MLDVFNCLIYVLFKSIDMRAIKKGWALVTKSRTQIWSNSIQYQCEAFFFLSLNYQWTCVLVETCFLLNKNQIERELVGWQCYCLNWWCQWQNKYSNTYKKYLETGIIYSFVQIIDLTLLFFDINKLTRVQMNESVMVHPILLIDSSFLIWYPE